MILPLQPKATRAAAYVRVSSSKDTMLHSLSAQVSYYSSLIQTHPGWLYCGVYSDEGLTGTKETRDGFQRMLSDCRKGLINLIITKSISRFARNTVTLLKTVRELKGIGVDVYFEEQNIHTLSSEGELMLTILASYAQEESLSVSENQKWRVHKCFENGIPWNGTLLGYRLVDGKYEIVQDEAETVKLIYSLYLDGLGYEGIARELNSKAFKTRNGNEWCHASVYAVLHNYSYTGNLILQSTYSQNHITKKRMTNTGEYPMYHVENSHDAIIPTELYNAVQEEAKRRAEKYSKPKRQNLTAFTGRVFCGNCGSRCRRKMRGNKPIWICNTYSLHGKNACHAKAVPESVLETIENAYDVKNYTLCDNNIISATLESGEQITEAWKYRSKSESWTDEKRREQKERMEKIWNEK